ncbi:uncharacterized protein LOC121736788 [Aricia agestis]|uniref:uncharacterized protein LOC121736788 n=1 Tax=Aricia agestis TaxID=91739 RepID=UPI001C2047D3|nr:uncharacterized protein LOC121736788 [Aricia agestis]
MSANRDEGPVYYREIQKNAYLKRIPTDMNTSKLRPLGHKKPPLKPMWTLFCVHNGRTPFLEQYPDTDATVSHRPAWRACLRSARHVTASVKPHVGDEYDFLVDTDHGPVRMLAPDWDSMQDWVSILRSKLHELRILSRGENVYGAPPVAPLPRAPARDPTSPLPPTPPVPPDRVPGIEIAPTRAVEPNETRDPPAPTTEAPSPPPTTTTAATITTTHTITPSTSSLSNLRANGPSNFIEPTEVDISQWDVPFSSLPSTSQDKREKKSVAKICGQNICLDDSILKRSVVDSNEEFFQELDRDEGFTQRLLVNDERTEEEPSIPQRSNVTVIQVSNKTPHTAIPVMGGEADNIFDFNFKQKLKVTPEDSDFVNIVNTEVSVQNDNNNVEITSTNDTVISDHQTEVSHSRNGTNNVEVVSNGNIRTNSTDETPRTNSYGTVFDNTTDYGHISLTTTVNLNVETKNKDGVYERLCMASTSNKTASPLSIRRILSTDKARKSSLPNLEVASESAYECLFPNAESQREERSTNVDSNVRVVRANVERSQSQRVNVERSQSQNAYDIAPRRREIVRMQDNSPKREKPEKQEVLQPKPIWKRGLTELSLLSRLRGIGQSKRQDSPTRQNNEDRTANSPAKVVHRSRPVNRVDSSRRRSNSLTNGVPCVPAPAPTSCGASALRVRQIAALRAEQRRGACLPAAVQPRDPPVFADYDNRVWVARWGGGNRTGRVGDRLVAVAAATASSAHLAATLVKAARTPRVDVLFHRIPLGQIYLVIKKDTEALGIKIDSECCITGVEAGSAAARAGLPPPGRWAVTEVNNRPINLVKGGQEELNRLGAHGTEVSLVLQPAALVRKLRAALKPTKTLLSFK